MAIRPSWFASVEQTGTVRTGNMFTKVDNACKESIRTLDNLIAHYGKAKLEPARNAIDNGRTQIEALNAQQGASVSKGM